MASDPHTLDRLRRILQDRHLQWEEKKMFGGDCFMLDDKMCFGTYKGGLILRVAPEFGEAHRTRPGMSLMVQGGREMPGYLMAEPIAYDKDADLESLISECLRFNPLVEGRKKKK